MASNAMDYLVQVALQLVSMSDDMQQLWIKLRALLPSILSLTHWMK
ncbi:hypothetical protein [Lactobacillus delbrueckii]|nr:hypothetical protein [Lactobacillus delbrueckii]